MSIEENNAVAGRWLAEFRGRDFPDLSFRATAELIAEGDYVLGQLKGGGTRARDPFGDVPADLPPGTGEALQFTSMAVLNVENGMITAEVGLSAARRHLGLIISA